MADPSMAQEILCALKRRIAAIDRPHSPAEEAARVATGAAGLDAALGGGIEQAALCEIRAAQSRDGGAATGFALGLASLAMRGRKAPLLWIGTASGFRETGFPYAEGLRFAVGPEDLLLAEARKPLDALWIAAEAAGLAGLAAVVIEIEGNPACLDLTATRRLQRGAHAGGRPVFLLRLAAQGQPTAAPLRLGVGPAPAPPREVFGQPLAGTIGGSAFTVTLEKCRANPGRQFILEWNCNERRFQERLRQAADPVVVVPASFERPDPTQPLRSGMEKRRKAG